MKESVRAALTYLRARSDDFGLDVDTLQEQDLHVHVPAGAIPKDGPSAGITMATVILSLLTQRPVRRNVAMTGEITLRGRAHHRGLEGEVHRCPEGRNRYHLYPQRE